MNAFLQEYGFVMITIIAMFVFFFLFVKLPTWYAEYEVNMTSNLTGVPKEELVVAHGIVANGGYTQPIVDPINPSTPDTPVTPEPTTDPVVNPTPATTETEESVENATETPIKVNTGGWVRVLFVFWHYKTPENKFLVGLWKVGNDVYYFQPPTGFMVVNVFVPVGNNIYYFGLDGKMKTGKLSLFTGNYYFKSNGAMYNNELFTENGKTYYATAGGVLARNSLHKINGKTYYFDSNNEMVKGKTIKIGVTSYTFDENGVLVEKK